MLSDVGMKSWSMDSKTLQKVNVTIEARETLGQQELKQTSLQTFARFFLVPWSVFGPSTGGTPEWGLVTNMEIYFGSLEQI